MAAQYNNVRVSRSTDGRNWTVIQTRNTSTAGISSDTIFDQPGPGAWYYRVEVFDNNFNPVGTTTILAIAMSR